MVQLAQVSNIPKAVGIPRSAQKEESSLECTAMCGIDPTILLSLG